MDDLKKLTLEVNSGEISYGLAQLSDKLDVNELESQISQKNVSVSRDEDAGLTNYKYSPLAASKQVWNDITMRTRGLVVDDENNIIGRGFNKFFNLSQVTSMGIDVDIDSTGTIMDKLDGSLGLCYKHNGKWRVSTAGGLLSDQAIHATELMNKRYSHTPYEEGKTMLVEIIYPENKIITDYGDMDDLVLLGGADNNGFWVHPEEFSFDGGMVDLKRGTLREAVEAHDPEDGKEGFVVRLDSGLIVKIKYPRYIMLHRAKFIFSKKKVWENMANDSFEEMMSILPDEFHDEARGYRDEINSELSEVLSRVIQSCESIPDGDRKDRAIWVNKNVDRDIKSYAMSYGVAGDSEEKIKQRIFKSLKP